VSNGCQRFDSKSGLDLCHKEADLVAIEFGDRRNAVDVLDEVFEFFGCAPERLERRLAVATL